MEKIVSLCKRRGFVYPSSEIYGGMAAIYDYGHYGILLKNNIRDVWWKSMIQQRDDIYGLDSAIFMHPHTWVASGHVANFSDPQINCKQCKNRFRADFINKKCPVCGSQELTKTKMFSLMVKSNLGSSVNELSEENMVYLRPETCGGIYLEFKNIVDTMHPTIPFGIAQVGKAFRNEIMARQFIFRTREFEQMEMQYFLRPEQVEEKYEMWKNVRLNWYLEYGIQKNKLRFAEHEKLAHYAKKACDIEFDFRSLGGFREIEGIHMRGDWDLSQHGKLSGTDLTFSDRETKEKFIPHVIETSAGLNRILLMFLDSAYVEETTGDGVRIVLKIDQRLAPVKIAVFPLLKNRPELVVKAKQVYSLLRNQYFCEFDDNGNIGKRYRRQDEIGTPYCVTVDFQTIEKDNSATVRERDSMKQERVGIENLNSYFERRIIYGTGDNQSCGS